MSNVFYSVLLKLQDLVRGERGAAAVEYGLLVGLIAVAIIGALIALGGQLDTMFCDVVTALNVEGGVPGSCPADAG
jgi:pilus assembly protein Flp/PilA